MRLAILFEERAVREVVEEEQNRAQEKLRRLTPRQKQVLRLMVEGQQNKIIAHECGLAVKSVENYRAEIMKRTEVKSFAALVRLFVLAG